MFTAAARGDKTPPKLDNSEDFSKPLSMTIRPEGTLSALDPEEAKVQSEEEEAMPEEVPAEEGSAKKVEGSNLNSVDSNKQVPTEASPDKKVEMVE